MVQDQAGRSVFQVKDFGAVGDGQTPDTPAIQAAIDACHAAGGGTVWVPAGKYITGPLFLKSRVTLHLEAGCVLMASQRLEEYPVVSGRWEGCDRQTYASLISGQNLDTIALTGQGTLDGSGAFWWELLKTGTLAYPRPRLISLIDCTNVLVRDVTLINSPSWTVNPVRCENVTVDRVTIVNPPDSPNTDGINPDSCRNVHISNCTISVGDDCITLKSGKEDQGRKNLVPLENITITNCIMARGHGGVVIGSETSGDVRRVTISNCVFTGTDRGIRLKSRRGRGGVVEDIRVDNIIMEDVLCPLTMNLYYGCGAWGNPEVSDKNPHPVDEGTPAFRRISLSHITARNVRLAAGFLYGLAEMPVEDVSLSDIHISMAAEAEPGYPEMADEMQMMQQAGFSVWNVRGLKLNQVEVLHQKGPALVIKESENVEILASLINGFSADAPLIDLENVNGAYLIACRAAKGVKTFLHLAGSKSQQVVVQNCYLALAQDRVAVSAEVDPKALVCDDGHSAL